MLQYYGDAMSIPPQIIVQREIEEDLARRSPRRSPSAAAARVEVRAAERGDKRRILELAERNARLALDQEKLKAERRRQQRVEALDGLQEALGLDALPLRIECFDISNLMGTHTVASMVVFEGGAPKKSDYRRFTIRGLEEGVPDDFAAMEEVLARRLAQWERQQDLSPHDPKRNESFATLPNLIVIDGGPGQLAAGLRALEGFRERGVAVVSLAKRIEEVFVPGPARPDRARPRHARAAAAPARARRGAPLRDHPPPHAPRPRDDRVDARRAARHRPGAQARAAQPLRLARGGPRRDPRAARGRPRAARQDRARDLRPSAPDGRITRRSPTMSEADDTLPDMATRPSRRQRLKFGRRDRDATTGDSAVRARRRRGRREPRPAGAGRPPLYAESRLEDLVVITGYSGAGKSTAMAVFEDAGYFCVDNLPPEMIRALVELFVHEGSKVERAAVVSDVRGGDYFEAFRAVLDDLAALGPAPPRAVPRRRRADAAHPLQGDAPPPSARARGRA